MVLGDVIIYAFGATWLAHALDLTAAQAWNAGVKDFLPGDAIKILLAAGLLPAGWWTVDKVKAFFDRQLIRPDTRSPPCPIPASNLSAASDMMGA